MEDHVKLELQESNKKAAKLVGMSPRSTANSNFKLTHDFGTRADASISSLATRHYRSQRSGYDGEGKSTMTFLRTEDDETIGYYMQSYNECWDEFDDDKNHGNIMFKAKRKGAKPLVKSLEDLDHGFSEAWDRPPRVGRQTSAQPGMARQSSAADSNDSDGSDDSNLVGAEVSDQVAWWLNSLGGKIHSSPSKKDYVYCDENFSDGRAGPRAKSTITFSIGVGRHVFSEDTAPIVDQLKNITAKLQVLTDPEKLRLSRHHHPGRSHHHQHHGHHHHSHASMHSSLRPTHLHEPHLQDVHSQPLPSTSLHNQRKSSGNPNTPMNPNASFSAGLSLNSPSTKLELIAEHPDLAADTAGGGDEASDEEEGASLDGRRETQVFGADTLRALTTEASSPNTNPQRLAPMPAPVVNQATNDLHHYVHELERQLASSEARNRELTFRLNGGSKPL